MLQQLLIASYQLQYKKIQSFPHTAGQQSDKKPLEKHASASRDTHKELDGFKASIATDNDLSWLAHNSC